MVPGFLKTAAWTRTTSVSHYKAGPHPHAVLLDNRDVLGLVVLVAGAAHLVLGRQVDPQLEAPQQAVGGLRGGSSDAEMSS